jgi:hypothetical protein
MLAVTVHAPRRILPFLSFRVTLVHSHGGNERRPSKHLRCPHLAHRLRGGSALMERPWKPPVHRICGGKLLP